MNKGYHITCNKIANQHNIFKAPFDSPKIGNGLAIVNISIKVLRSKPALVFLFFDYLVLGSDKRSCVYHVTQNPLKNMSSLACISKISY